MLDINYIRNNVDIVKKAVHDKVVDADVDAVLQLDDERRALVQRVENLRSERNEISAKVKSGEKSDELISRGKELKLEIGKVEELVRANEGDYLRELKKIPNIPYEDVPVGLTEDDNVVAEVVGEPKQFDFEPKNHWEIGQIRNWIDKDRAAKVAGARFAYIEGELVRLQMALVSFVMDTLGDEVVLTEVIERFVKPNLPEGVEVPSTKPFRPILPPLMLKTDMYDAMDRLEPREDRYKIEGQDLWLQGSAEHVLGSMYADEIIDEADMPVRMLGYATSFRQEAGTYGKDMEGIIRMHQFDKLEMESFTTRGQSFGEHLLMVGIQRYMVEALELPYRVLQKCTYDIGKPDARGIDIEVFLPGQGKYRETHTADYMTDYQSRRLKTRVRRENGEVELVHTNDATAFACGRALVAIIENYQTAEAKVRVPEVLKKYLGNKEEL
jgi:seryl-tRNA synthetase